MMPQSAATPDRTGDLVVDRQYGAVLEGRWVPAPRFVLRRDRVLPLIETMDPGRVVEVGCGSGALLRELAARGHACRGLESSPEALRIAREMLADFPASQVVDAPQADWENSFDLLLAFEVLEHIEDDVGALREWAGWLRPGGRIILSMPAHMKMWSPRDVWAGHFRRYGRHDMVKLAEDAGLMVDKVECYGFPLSNLTHWLGNASVRGQDYAGAAADQAGATAASGTDRATAIKYFGMQRSWVGRAIMGAACQVQRPFLGTPLGDGYLLVATKP